jgi:hypothetical protein
MKVYDLLWKRSEDKGKARWEKVGILMEKGGLSQQFIKLVGSRNGELL